MIVIGVTGTLGAGKGAVVDYLVNKWGFKHYSARKFIEEEITKRGLKANRDNLVMVGNDLRRKYGAGYIARKLLERARKLNTDSVIESLRNPMEVTELKNSSSFYLFSVSAEPMVRYERIKKRSTETDKISYKKFLEQEKREMISEDESKQNLEKVISMADFHLTNNKDIKNLHQQIDKVLMVIKKRVN
jgi:dephospho-CoA kinase